MKFEDENFEEEFLEWLNSKTKEELIDSFKKYTKNNNEVYKNNKGMNIDENIIYSEIKSQQFKSDLSIVVNNKKISDEGEKEIWENELATAA